MKKVNQLFSFVFLFILTMNLHAQDDDFNLIEPIIETPEMNELQMRNYTKTMYRNWGIPLLGLDTAMQQYTGKNIKICIIDTGRPEHQSLTKHIKSSANFTAEPSDIDGNGHSTHVAGIIAEIVPDAELYFAKVLTSTGSGSTAGVTAGIEWCIQQGTPILNLSLGSSTPNLAMKSVIDAAVEKGFLFIAAAGNSGQGATDLEDKIGYPAKYPGVMAIGSMNQMMKVSFFSSPGIDGDIVAPGEKILSTYKNDQYIVLSGTSMATPYVAGAAAIFLQRNQISVNIDTIFQRTAKDLLPEGYDARAFHGVVCPAELFNWPKTPPVEEEPEDPTKPIRTIFLWLQDNWFAIVAVVVTAGLVLLFRKMKQR